MKIVKLFIVLFVLILVVGRLLLPHYLLKYVIKTVNTIPEYHVSIADLDVSLLRGSYTLKSVKLYKTTIKIPDPFFAAQTMDLSVQWGALLHGKFLAKIALNYPVINFITDPHGKRDQLTISAQWEDVVKALFPLNFNRIAATHGEVNFKSYTATPPFKLTLKDISLNIDNMNNEYNIKDPLPSTMNATGLTEKGAEAHLKGKFNPYAKQPTFYLTAELKNMPISEAGNFLKHYTAIVADGGRFSLYVELAAKDNKITGYAKPFIKNLHIAPSKTTNPVSAIYNSAAVVVSKIVTNQKHQTIATKIKISGNIEDPNTNILSIIGYLLSHAFIQALIPSVDHDVKMRDIYYGRQSS